MPKDTEFYNASTLEKTAIKTSDIDGGNRSTSSAKYRVSYNLPEPNSTDAPSVASRSRETRLSTTKVSTILKHMSKSDGADGPSTGTTGKVKNSRYIINTEAIAPSKMSGATTGASKLPQKLRQHVNQLRNQFASGPASSRNLSMGFRSSSPSASSHKAPRPSMSSVTIGAKRFSITTTAAIHSRRSNQLQQLQLTKHDERLSEPVAEAPKTSVSSQNPEATNVNAGTFQDLLRPLQTSLSCASLSGEWSSDEEDEAEQFFRQSEREHSRMLRVCCSIDNLMQSIGDQAQEQKLTEVIVRGATRDLVKLFQFAMKQAVSIIFDKSDDQINSNNNPSNEEGRGVEIKINGKEAQYAMEFLLEINERIGKLYEFARSVFVNEVDGLRQRIKKLEDELAAAILMNDQLNNEMRDLRDFHEHNDNNVVDSFTGDAPGARYSEIDNRNDDASIAALAFPEIFYDTTGPGDGECSELKQQCQELSRLLEMAKQEIRLSHHERDVQKARVVEVSSALFHDSELGLLRNQLQSEKKRVRVLERENLTLRESHHDQALKLQTLEALQTSTSVSGLAVSSSTNISSVVRHSISASRPSDDTIPMVQLTQQESFGKESSEEQSPVHTNDLSINTQDNQYNFINSGAVQPQQVTATTWFSRIVNPPPLTSLRKSRKKQREYKPEQPPPVVLSKFLVRLLMTDKQRTTAKEESKVRRQGSVPTLTPPARVLSARRDGSLTEDRKMAEKKRRPQSAMVTRASSSNVSRTNTSDAEDNPEEVVASCLQLVWVFYQRFLVAVEAQHLLATRGLGGDPTLGSGAPSCAGNPSIEPVSLSLIIFHFFLERCNRELDAARELEQFVRCLHGVRTASYNLDLFCQFLEETCSRQELCFYLWVCQAMDDVRLGIPYDDPVSNGQDSTNNYLQDDPTKFVCVLKATFLARTIFRLLHFKVLCQPPAVGSGKRRRKSKQKAIKRSSSNAALVVAPTSPSSVSPKRRPKTRLGELTAAQSPKADSRMLTTNNGEAVQVEEKDAPLHVAAQIALRDIIENNQGEPITLETFNNLLLQYAVVPSPEELTARLGNFYQPTGDERKLPIDVFFALLMEMYKFQLQWQRDQLRALFIHLNHQEEVQQRVAEKMIKAEEANRRGEKREDGDSKNPPKSRRKRGKRRDGAADSGVDSKYLRGLSRSMLRELLLQSGIVHESDVAQVDMDWLFAELLQAASGIAADITFDTFYDALQKRRWLSSTKLRVDALAEDTKVASMLFTKRNSVDSKVFAKTRSSSFTIPSPIALAIRDNWRIYARHSLALCNNDPNVFVRRHSQRLLHYVDQELGHLVREPDSRDPVNEGEDAIQCIREFLSFAWRVAAKRSNGTHSSNLKQTCLTEVFLVSQALRATVDTMSGYNGQFDPLDDKAAESKRGNSSLFHLSALQSFYDISRMNLQYIVRDKLTSNAALDSGSSQLHELENVLALYAAHIAHLFHRFSEARYNCVPQVSFHRWKAMVYELDLVDPQRLPFSKLQTLFSTVALGTDAVKCGNCTNAASLDQEIGVGKTSFSELFVLVAITRYRFTLARKLEKAQLTTTTKARDDNKEAVLEAAELADRPGRIMAQFCRDVIVSRAFRDDNALVERNFAAKLSCPLVGRALLEHRSFLRTVFFYYAKQDEVAADERAALEEQALIREMQENGNQQNGMQNMTADSSPLGVSGALLQPDPGSDFQLEKTKRSSMSFGEFQTFLTAFSLLDDVTDDSCLRWNSRKVALADAQHIFSSVMSLENDDTLQLEFDEFAAAMVALAVHLDPSPFSLWHQKLDEFAMRLRRAWETMNEGTTSC